MADREAVVILSDAGLAEPGPELGPRLADITARARSIWARTMELRQQTERALADAQAARKASAIARRERRFSPASRDLLQRSEYARLLARLQTMPVIEQAKGILMAQSRCGEAEAFDMLRRASQRSNVPVRDLAAQIVGNAARTAAPAAGPDRQRPAPGHPAPGRPPGQPRAARRLVFPAGADRDELNVRPAGQEIVSP